jgi:UDP-N-acetylglucosamine/UDP-N-acetyl-alpha-D-glucosaminouronate 4-epimerase
MRLLVLGAGYVGACLAKLALEQGDEVLLADNWYATDREQLRPLEETGARVYSTDIRIQDDVVAVLDEKPDRIFLLAAQASRPVSEQQPDYTEETNGMGVRRVAQILAERGTPPVVFGSSLNVYGTDLTGEVTEQLPYGAPGDLAHITKVYGELVLAMHARRGGFELSLARLGIVYGPSPVEHTRLESLTVVDKFRALVKRGEEPALDNGGAATIGVVHVEDAARALLAAEPGPSNVAAETITVSDVARLARGEARKDDRAFTVTSPYEYRHRLESYLRP